MCLYLAQPSFFKSLLLFSNLKEAKTFYFRSGCQHTVIFASIRSPFCSLENGTYPLKSNQETGFFKKYWSLSRVPLERDLAQRNPWAVIPLQTLHPPLTPSCTSLLCTLWSRSGPALRSSDSQLGSFLSPDKLFPCRVAVAAGGCSLAAFPSPGLCCLWRPVLLK